MPGLGGSVINWMAYSHAVQSAKDKSQFGKGDVRGVLAPESGLFEDLDSAGFGDALNKAIQASLSSPAASLQALP